MNRRAVIVALFVSLILSFALWKKMNVQAPTAPLNLEPPKIATVPAVFAKRRVPARARIEPNIVGEWFERREVPSGTIPLDTITELASLSMRYTSVTLFPGDVVIEQRLMDKDAIPALAFAVPRGRRAFTIAVSKVSGVAGFIQQGDYVDVIATFRPTGGEQITKLVLQDIPVLAIGQTFEFDSVVPTSTPAIAGSKVDLVTLAVTPAELERLALLDSGYNFRLVLKNPKDKGEQVTTQGATEKIVMNAIGFNPDGTPMTPPIATPTAPVAEEPITSPVAIPAVMPPLFPTAAPSVSSAALMTTETGKVDVFYGRRREEMSKYGAQNTDIAGTNPSATVSQTAPESGEQKPRE